MRRGSTEGAAKTVGKMDADGGQRERSGWFYYVLGVGQYIVLRPVCLTPTSSSCCTRLLLLRLRQHPPIYRPFLLLFFFFFNDEEAIFTYIYYMSIRPNDYLLS